jgi:hypothetical protein
MLGVEREVRRAGLQDAEQRDDEFDRSIEQDGDYLLGACAEALEKVRNAHCASVQLAVRDLLILENDGRSIRGALDLRFDQRV